MMTFFIPTTSAMEALGGQLAQACQGRGTLYLKGELGTGKTTLVRGFLRALGYIGRVKSPTYTLVEPYYIGDSKIYHFDLYRLVESEELDYIGIRDYLEDQAIFLIEWPERGGDSVPVADVQLQLSYQGKARLLELRAETAQGQAMLHYIQLSALFNDSDGNKA